MRHANGQGPVSMGNTGLMQTRSRLEAMQKKEVQAEDMNFSSHRLQAAADFKKAGLELHLERRPL